MRESRGQKKGEGRTISVRKINNIDFVQHEHARESIRYQHARGEDHAVIEEVHPYTIREEFAPPIHPRG